MAGKTKINGTDYTIIGGRTKIDGTNYSIKGGKTKIDGTNYTIKGGRTKIDGTDYTIMCGKTKITISGSYSDICAVFVDSKWLKDGTHTFTDTSKIEIYVDGLQTAYSDECRVYLNGTLVKSGACVYTISNVAQYSTIDIVYESKVYNSYFYCYITTT